MDKIICEPASFRSRGSTPLTVACVPTGMYTGVSISPCGVCSTPALAPVSGSVLMTSKLKNRSFMSFFGILRLFICFTSRASRLAQRGCREGELLGKRLIIVFDSARQIAYATRFAVRGRNSIRPRKCPSRGQGATLLAGSKGRRPLLIIELIRQTAGLALKYRPFGRSNAGMPALSAAHAPLFEREFCLQRASPSALPFKEPRSLKILYYRPSGDQTRACPR